MLAETIWVLGILLEGLLLFRSWRARHFLKFPFFFSYVGFVLVQSVVRYSVNKFYPSQYANVYWCTEFVGVVAGCAVVLTLSNRSCGISALPSWPEARSLAFVATFLRVRLRGKAHLAGLPHKPFCWRGMCGSSRSLLSSRYWFSFFTMLFRWDETFAA